MASSRAMFKAQYGSSLIVADLHAKLFAALQSVVDGDVKHLIINMPPRYGKTLIAIKMFVSWCFALNPKCQFMHLSYSDLLVNDNSSTIREIMTLPLYKELFPQRFLMRTKVVPGLGKQKLKVRFTRYQHKARLLVSALALCRRCLQRQTLQWLSAYHKPFHSMRQLRLNWL